MQFAPDEASGWCVLHQMFSFDWSAFEKLAAENKNELISELALSIKKHESFSGLGQTAIFHTLGHKSTLCFIHFRPTFDLCAQIELDLSRLKISEFLSLKHSYLSIVELGMYHVSKKVVESLLEKGVKPYSEEWNSEYEQRIAPHREPLYDRCFLEIPSTRYFSFYPMNKRRGEHFNWYMEPISKRAEYMMEHGMTGRRYAGKIKQIISGSIGFDDWEWGVDLFSDDPMSIKRLVYDMRFDEATSKFGEFDYFFFGIRLHSAELTEYFSGKIPLIEKYSDPKEINKNPEGAKY